MTQPADVLNFWFDGPEHTTTRGEWFKKDATFDDGIRTQFAGAVDEAIAGGFTAWEQTHEGRLALIILLDQFPRNLFRGDAKSFAGDARALTLAKRSLAAKDNEAATDQEKLFLFLPFEHSEELADQDTSLELFEALGNKNLIDYAVRHRDIIVRFGRFPHRNAVVGRASTPEEETFLQEPNSGF